jgi:signal transduction histidine kinase
MRTLLHLLSRERNKQQRLMDLKTLDNRTRALNTLLDELVLYDQIETGRSLLKIEAIDLGAFLPACVEEVAGHHEAQAVPVRCEIAPELGIVYLDQRKLKHILLNLISNALKFTQEGHITVRARPENALQWRLEVEDTGMGMTSAVRERAFEEYFSESNREQGGVGLGLAIAHRLSMALEAKVTLRSVPGQGTHFQLVFPRCLTSPEERGTADPLGMHALPQVGTPLSSAR